MFSCLSGNGFPHQVCDFCAISCIRAAGSRECKMKDVRSREALEGECWVTPAAQNVARWTKRRGLCQCLDRVIDGTNSQLSPAAPPSVRRACPDPVVPTPFQLERQRAWDRRWLL